MQKDPPRSRKPKAAIPPGKKRDRGATPPPGGRGPAGADEDLGSNLTGQLLIAMPGMEDPRFAQSVVFLCAHTSDGAMGLVLNRPLSAPTFEDLLRQLEIKPVPPARSIRLCHGGPVDNARGFVLHTTDWTGEGSLRVDEQLALTASLDILKAIAEGGGPRESLLALGYAGWAAGQLENEMRQNAWLTVPADPDLLFDGKHDTKWRRALAKLHIDPAHLAGSAGHA
ncbi:MAG: YqgE/AlgH family protein [Rhodospirillales bacterium]|nr:YqgE/AlgH family protein [Rhodospirillales bacterium]